MNRDRRKMYEFQVVFAAYKESIKEFNSKYYLVVTVKEKLLREIKPNSGRCYARIE